jgi:hypothetical protein
MKDQLLGPRWWRWVCGIILLSTTLAHAQAGGGGSPGCCGPNAGPQFITWLSLPTNSALLQNPTATNTTQTWIITNLACYGRVLVLQDAPTNIEVLLNRSNFYASHGIPVFDNVPNTNGNFYFTDAGYGPYRWGVQPGTVDLGYDFPNIINSQLAPLPSYNVSFFFLDGQPDICELILAEIGIAAKTSNTLSQPFFFRTEYDLIYAVSNYPHGPSAETLFNNTYGFPLSLNFAGTHVGSAWALTGGDDYNTGWTLFQASNTLQTALLPPGSGTDINGNPYPPFGTSAPPYPYITVTVDGQEIGDHFSLTLGYTCCTNPTTNCLQISCPPDKEVACNSGWTFDSPTASCCCPNVFGNPATGLSTNLIIQSLGLITNGICPQETVTENWLIIDGCGETNMCSQTVTITNCCTNTCIRLQCPSNIVVAACSNCAVVTYAAQVSDPCCQGSAGPTVTLTYNPPSGSCFPQGTNVVQVTATDTCGNITTCSFTVAVVPGANCCTNTLNSLVLNTGYNPNSNSVYGFGQADATWWVTKDPTLPPTTVPRPATVIMPNVAWAAPMTNSEWISAYGTDNDILNGEYDFQTYFCTAANASNLVLNVCLRADDAAAVGLNGNIIPLAPANTAFNAPNPACGVAVNPAWFVAGGQNVVTLYVTNLYGVAMGVDAEISVTGSGILPLGSPCCPFGSGISGQKFFDLNCDGIQEPGEPGLSGWPIQLSNGSNTVTDVNGYYYFTNLTPGVYTVTEVQQAGWTQTAPPGGSYTVTLTNLQQINNLNFGNCIQGVTNCLQVTCPSNKTVACGSGWTFDTPTATTCCTNDFDSPTGTGTNLLILSTGITTNGVCPQLVITETWSIIDACGDSAQCSQSVLVTNCCSNLPCFHVTCPNAKQVQCGSNWNFDPPTATTCCTNLFVTSGGLATNILITPLGAVTNGNCPQTITETWSVMDACNDFTNCSQTVTVINNQPPVINCPSNILIAVTNCTSNVTVCYTPTAIDPCSGSNLTVTCSPPSCSGFAPGTTTTVTCVATNCNGLTNSCTFTVTIECCTTQTCCGPNLGSQIINWLQLPTNGPTLIPGSYSYSPPGSWIVTNLPCYGRVLMTQTFPDLLSWFINTNTTNVPNIYGTFNYTELNYGPYSWNTPSGMLNLYASNQDNYTVTYYFLDGAPNPCSVVLGIDGLAQPTFADLSQPFTFRTEFDLTNNPNGAPSAHTTLNGIYGNALIPGVTGTNVGSAEALDFWGDYRNTGWAALQPAAALMTTNLPAASIGGYSGPLTNLPYITLNVSQMRGDGIGFTVGYICCTNCSGSTNTCLNVQCPSPKQVKCGQQWNFDTPTATSCCTNFISGTRTNVLIIPAGIVTNSNCPPQVITESWTIVDGCNDVTNCSQTVTVLGCCNCLNVTCPTNKTVQCGSTWSFDQPTATSCCTNLIQTSTGTLTNVLITTVSTMTNGVCPKFITRTWSISDGCGDTTNCSQMVTVVDTMPPVIHCPTNTIIATLNSNCQLVIPGISVTATDNCTPPCSLIYTQNPTNGTIINGTSAFVTVTVTDLCGNSSSCVVLVQGIYRRGLVVVFPTNLVASNCVVPCVSNNLVITDCACKPGDVRVTQSPPCNAPIGPGVYLITVTVTDCNGATATKQIPLTETLPSFRSALTNTGINTIGGLLANHTVDPHYLLGPVPAPPPGGYTSPNSLVETGLWPWLELPAYASQWIAPNTLAPPNFYLNTDPSGYYVYTNRFTLPAGLNPATASITGRWAADDGGAALYLNGAPTGNTIPISGWNHWTPFVINSNFVTGVNTLLFIVTNAAAYGHSPTGLRVEFLTATACAACAPPVISWITPAQSLQAGSTANLTVQASGTPPFIYQWTVNNTNIPGATNATLKIPAITYTNAGIYSTIVIGPCGTATAVTHLTVTPPLPWSNGWWNVQSASNVLAATFGPDLVLAGSSNASNFALSTGSTEDFGLPNPGGQIVNVMDINPQYGAILEMPPIVPAGAASDSAYTVIMDIYEPDTSLGTPSTLYASDYITNLGSGGQDGVSLTLDASNNLHITGSAAGVPFDSAASTPMPVDQWNRVALVVNNPQNGDNVSLAGYLNGVPVVSNITICTCCVISFTNVNLNWNTGVPIYLSPPSTMVTNGEFYVSSIQFHAAALSPQMIAGIGAPDSGPAPINQTQTGPPPILTATLAGGQVNISWLGSPYVLQETTDLASGDWATSTAPFTEVFSGGNVASTAKVNPGTSGPAKFYRLIFAP